MKAFSESPSAITEGAGLILLFDGEVGRSNERPDERNQTGILTPGLNLAPAFPTQWRSVALGICSPLQWRNRPRFSRGSLTSYCVLRMDFSIAFKEPMIRNPQAAVCQANSEWDESLARRQTATISAALCRWTLCVTLKVANCRVAHRPDSNPEPAPLLHSVYRFALFSETQYPYCRDAICPTCPVFDGCSTFVRWNVRPAFDKCSVNCSARFRIEAVPSRPHRL